MIQATVKGFELFNEVTVEVERLVLVALEDGVKAAEAAAQAGSTTIDLELETGVAPTVDGATGWIYSKKRGSKTGVRLAPFFDRGTLGQRQGKLKRNRKSSWQVNRGGSTYTAARHEITPDEGIPAERFFLKARAAGKRALLARIDRGI